MAGDVAMEGRSNERRRELLDAARQLFFQKGYRGTTVQQIARRAGYSKRTVYLDFESKDALFLAVCAEGGALLLEQLRRVPLDDDPVEVAIDRLLDVYITFSRTHSEYFRMIFSEATADIVANSPPALRRRLAELERACLGVVVAWAERAMGEGEIEVRDPWEAAGILVGAATGIVLLSMGGSQTVFSRERLESLAKSAVRICWRGLRAAPAGAEEGG
jgi:AcrR family transcriptional regulator